MRIFAVSDLHTDYEENRRLLDGLSVYDFQDDILIVAGDIAHFTAILEKTLISLRRKFKEVCYIPGNHDLWLTRETYDRDSFAKKDRIKVIAAQCGVRMEPLSLDQVTIVPLYAWYDYSFGMPSADFYPAWADFTACSWPEGYDMAKVTRYFLDLNETSLCQPDRFVISFSHFLPRIDLMPSYIPAHKRELYPVLGTNLLETQIRRLGSRIHVYGHSHVNVTVEKENILYINNAYGYPYETMITAKQLKCIHTC